MENFKILEEKGNSLFNRREIKLSVEAEVTPSNVEVEKFISEKFSTPIENIKIRKILGRFGSNIFTILVNLYGSEEHKNGIESKLKKNKKTKGEKKWVFSRNSGESLIKKTGGCLYNGKEKESSKEGKKTSQE